MDKKLLINYRKWFLTILTIVLFINWAYASDLYTYLKEVGESSSTIASLKVLVGEKAVHIAIIKGGAFAIATAINAGISLLIIYVYFEGNKHLLKKGLIILLSFAAISAICEIIAFIVEADFLFRTTYYAITILPSPLVEAILIPVLKLYQQSNIRNNN